jgi:DNA-binding IclR family transcriptional regulator
LLLAVGCSAPISRITAAQLVHFRERLIELAAEMTQRLRHPGPGQTVNLRIITP